MSTTLAQFLYTSDVFGSPTELINGARTALRLQAEALCGGGEFSDVLENAGCDALLSQPCVMAEDGTTSEWVALDDSPTAAPWYTGSAASLEAYGFYIEEWTGIDGEHHGRSVTPLGRGGANYGPQSHGPRVMKLNVLLLGSSERGLTHLFRWLETTLLGCCSCDDASVWVREFCPTDAILDPAEGMGRLTRVVLLEGPVWEAPISDSSGCSVRRASFTLGAGDPCMYREPVSCAVEETMTLTVDPVEGNTATLAADGYWTDVDGNAGVRCTAPALVNSGSLAARVTISSAIEISSAAVRRTLPDIRIAGYSHPAGGNIYGSDARKIGEFILSGRGTSGLEIVVDLAERSIKYRENTGPWGNWIDGSRLIAQPVESHLRRWWRFAGCDDGVIVVEPVYRSGYNSTQVTWADIQDVWTVSIDTIEVFSCC